MKELTSSVVIVNALRLEPNGLEANTKGTCALCGLTINESDMYSPLSIGPGFMDDISMAARGSNIICGHCNILMSVELLRQTGYGVFSSDGILPFRKWNDISIALTNPPNPPFVMVYATANNQHMGWRAPVNLSRELFYVRVGLRDLKIRRQVLLEAVKKCRILGEALSVKNYTDQILKIVETEHTDSELLSKSEKILENIWFAGSINNAIDQIDNSLSAFQSLDLHQSVFSKIKKGIKELRKNLQNLLNSTNKTQPNPFVEISPDLKSPNHGLLKGNIFRASFMAKFNEEIQFIMSLTAGEIWGLRFVLTQDAGRIEQ